MEVMKIEPYLEQRRCSGGGGPIPCPQCGKMFAKEFDIKRHMFTHTGEKPFKVSLWSHTVIRKNSKDSFSISCCARIGDDLNF